jgi:hypothetical protein
MKKDESPLQSSSKFLPIVNTQDVILPTTSKKEMYIREEENTPSSTGGVKRKCSKRMKIMSAKKDASGLPPTHATTSTISRC